jgi:acyl-CoA reductase-like NAD-dependent aldehyde dehydrogenase
VNTRLSWRAMATSSEPGLRRHPAKRAARSSSCRRSSESAETRRAIEAAAAALPAWRATWRAPKTAKERAKAFLRRWYELIMAAQEDLARIMTAEQGKPLAETRGEVAYGAASSSGSPRRPSASTAM